MAVIDSPTLWIPSTAIETRWHDKAITETDQPSSRDQLPARIERRGYEPDIPIGGTTVYEQSNSASIDRRELIEQLVNAYLACPWSSACVDVIASTIIAGGIDVGLDAPDQERLQVQPDQIPGPVAELKRLIDYTNPNQNIRQLLYEVFTDLEVTGDAFIEVTWMLDIPVALWRLDPSTMIPGADEHGTREGYKQVLETGGRTVEFEPHEIIHISLPSPKGGVYGVSPTERAILPITNWLFTESLLKETMRKGNPSRLHVDWPHDADPGAMRRFEERYLTRNIGIANIANPLLSQGGAKAQEFKASQIAEYLATLDKERDTITSTYGVPNRKVGIAEAGSLGGAGVETGQDRTFRVNKCGPLAELVLEALNFALLSPFGVDGWKIEFGRIDWRDDLEAEQIRDVRIRNGTWSINRARADADEPPVDGGDIPILVDRQGIIAIPDLPEYSTANLQMAKAQAESAQAGADLAASGGGLAPGTTGLAPNAPPQADQDPGDGTGATGKLAQLRQARQKPATEMARIEAAYQDRRRRWLEEMADA